MRKSEEKKNLNTEIDSKQTIEKFLAQYKINELKELIKETDRRIRSLNKLISGRMAQPQPYGYECFIYCLKKTFLCIKPLKQKEQIEIFLKKMSNQEIMDDNWQPSSKSSYYGEFTWQATIKDKTDCEKIINSIKEYLEKLKAEI